MRLNKTSGLKVGFCSEERAVQLLNKIEGYGLQEKSYYYIRNRGAGMSFFGGTSLLISGHNLPLLIGIG